MLHSFRRILFFCALNLFMGIPLHASDNCSEVWYPDQSPFVGCSASTPMTWNADNSATELDATANRIISISGGQGPYTWTVNGNGFYLDSAYTKKSITTGIPSTTLYTNNACGAGAITITDSCGSTVQEAVRSTNGKWVEIPHTGCIGGAVTISINWGNIFEFTSKNGEFKQIQNTNFFNHSLLTLEILHEYDCNWRGGSQSQYQEECNAWAMGKCPSSKQMSQISSLCIEAPWCHGNLLPQCSASPYVSDGFCPWNIIGKLGCQNCGSRCVTSNNYYRWSCND